MTGMMGPFQRAIKEYCATNIREIVPLAASKTCFFINLSHCEKRIVTRFFLENGFNLIALLGYIFFAPFFENATARH
jgi:hypothetical protein